MKYFVALAMAAIVMVWRGYAITVLWAWFAVATFALPALTIPVAIGLTLVVYLLAPHTATTLNLEAATSEQVVRTTLTAAGVPMVGLMLGWVVHLFV